MDDLTVRRALRIARKREDPLGIAYCRLRLAYERGSGIRLSRDEVDALFLLDEAIRSASDEIIEDRLALDEEDGS